MRFFDYLYAENDYPWQRGKTIAQRQEAMDNRRSEMLENRPENPDIGEKKRAALLPRQKSVNFSAWQREWLHLLQERDRTLRQLIDQVKKTLLPVPERNSNGEIRILFVSLAAEVRQRRTIGKPPPIARRPPNDAVSTARKIHSNGTRLSSQTRFELRQNKETKIGLGSPCTAPAPASPTATRRPSSGRKETGNVASQTESLLSFSRSRMSHGRRQHDSFARLPAILETDQLPSISRIDSGADEASLFVDRRGRSHHNGPTEKIQETLRCQQSGAAKRYEFWQSAATYKRNGRR